MKFYKFIISLSILSFLLTSCSPSTPTSNTPVPTFQAKASLPTIPPLPTETNTPQPITLWLAPYLPEYIRQAVKLPEGMIFTEDENNASLKLGLDPQIEINQTTYALIAPLTTITDGFKSTDLMAIWKNDFPGNSEFKGFVLEQSSFDLLKALWGPPGKVKITIVTPQELDAALWSNHALSVIPFEQITPRFKVLEVNDTAPIRKDYKSASYPLLIPFGLSGDSSAQLTKAADGSVLSVPDKNYDPKLLTTVLITGVTALVRGTAAMMEIKGNTYPGQDVRDWLREADITTITNEVSFDPRCPSPSPQPNDLKFCSKPNYIELLEDVGTDVIDMSGDHLQDKGTDPIAYSLDMYKKRGWKYYGGGYNLEDAQKPLLMEKNGTKIAFLGCNAKAPGYSSLDENTPGALHCDMNWLTSKIKEVKAAGYQPIVTFQHLEYYSYNSHPILQKDFREASDAGAVIISGSQGHQPQAIELYNKSFLHYGLGNLFFDQYYEGIPTRQAFLDRHVFYNNQYINTELLTIMFVDLARPRPMTVEERQNLLGIVFEASGVK